MGQRTLFNDAAPCRKDLVVRDRHIFIDFLHVHFPGFSGLGIHAVVIIQPECHVTVPGERDHNAANSEGMQRIGGNMNKVPGNIVYKPEKLIKLACLVPLNKLFLGLGMMT